MSPPSHPVLAIDTCGSTGTAALVNVDQDTQTVTCMRQVELGGRAASADLVPAIAAMLEEAGLNLRSLEAIVVVHGPGSFTGVRVGLSTAKGLAQGAGLPVLAVSRLAVLAHLAGQHGGLLLDAGRGEYYARYGEREWLASHQELQEMARAGASLVVAEPAVAALFAEFQPIEAGPLDACAAARAALARLARGDVDDLATLDANYLRRSDAELFARPHGARG